MKYICKRPLPFCDVGQEVSIEFGSTWTIIRFNQIDRRVEWFHKWGPIEDWFEPKRWRAENGYTYFYVNSESKVDYLRENNDPIDNNQYSCGNYFQTKEQAEKARLLVLEALKKAHE